MSMWTNYSTKFSTMRVYRPTFNQTEKSYSKYSNFSLKNTFTVENSLYIFYSIIFLVLEIMGAQFYTIFANAAGGERDPRCLIRVFTIFVHVLERMDFGVLMEDLFELVACYWPIEYQPVNLFHFLHHQNISQKSTDKNPLSREALSAACNSCLLANRAFSAYTYQLISEKLVEDDESATHEKKLEACKLLVSPKFSLLITPNFRQQHSKNSEQTHWSRF